jgi:NADH:ubiquinone oxidoreductase subunit K
VLLIKQYERNSKQLNLILNQINIYLVSFKCSQPKATGGVFLIFEWTLVSRALSLWYKVLLVNILNLRSNDWLNIQCIIF